MYIQRLTLKNFQSHVDTTIDLDKGINVFIGKGDSGKTAIVRALKWVLYNVPRGDGFIRKGESFTEVTVQCVKGTDCINVTRKKGAQENSYTLSINGAVQKFENFGLAVPLEVRKALGIQEANIGDSSFILNISEQMDPPFLLTEPAPYKAKVLSTLSGFVYVNEAVQELTQDNKKISQNMTDISTRLQQYTAGLKNFSTLDPIEKKLQDVQELLNLINDQKTTEEKLSALYTRYYKILKFWDHADHIVDVLQDGEKCLESAVELTEYETFLRSVYEKNQEVSNQIETCKLTLNDLLSQEEQLKNYYVTLLQETGECPVCHNTMTDDYLSKVKDYL